MMSSKTIFTCRFCRKQQTFVAETTPGTWREAHLAGWRMAVTMDDGFWVCPDCANRLRDRLDDLIHSLSDNS